MPETSTPNGRTFEANIEILFDELALATKWGRPSVLLAVHKSKFGQAKAEKALEARLKQEGRNVVHIVVNDQRSDIVGQIFSAPKDQNPVFFISNIDWGGGEDGHQAYRGLNLQREAFVENSVRAVFWLTTNEAASLPRLAPDFWAFRHRVVEFVNQRVPADLRLPVGVLAWDIQKSVDPFDGLSEGILARQELLGRLPDRPESLSARIELHYNLGYLHWIGAEPQAAEQSLRAALDLTQGHEFPDLKAKSLNGMGIIQYEAGDYAGALDRFQEGLQAQPSNTALLTNAGAASCMLRRSHDAATYCKKALRASPADADCWNRCGYIYAAMGKPDDAIAHLMTAKDLAPRIAAHHEALAVFYGLVERPEEAQRHLEAARRLETKAADAYLGILEAAIVGDPDEAEGLLRQAVAAGKISRAAGRRDPNLGILFEPAQIEALAR